MRPLFSAVLAAGLLGSQVAAAAQCAMPRDKSAFDVAVLKTHLMVTALACDQRDKYNAFVTRFRNDLVTQEKALGVYFGRAFGRSGQREHDDYVTSVANVQSEDGLKLGTGYCDASVPMFDRVLALPPATELASFAADLGRVQPITLVACVVPEATTRTAQASTSSHH
jgi:hypothetical protein